jgi:Flp pilus assembly protein TadG
MGASTSSRGAAASWSRRAEDLERGSVTLFVVVLALGLLAMAGLVVDGGAKLTAQRRANNLAEQAARAGAQAADEAALRSGTTTLNSPAARDAALRYLSAAGYGSGRVTVSGVAVDVRVSTTTPTRILGVLGVHSLRVTGQGHAELLRGVRQEQ